MPINEKVILVVPEIFCLIRNHDETIEFLKKVNFAVSCAEIKQIEFDYSKCAFIGLDASSIMDFIVIAAKSSRKKTNRIVLSGNLPKSIDAQKMLIVSGLIKTLNIYNANNIVPPNFERLDPFIDEEPNLTTNKIINYYNKCLKKNKYELSERGINELNNLIGENVDNLCLHCGEGGTWLVAGHFDQDTKANRGRGTLVLASFGKTFYESLSGKDSSLSVRNRIKSLIETRIKNGDSESEKEAIWTLLALQYRVSRLNNEENPDRGTGTIKMIDAFMQLGRTTKANDPIMAINTGKAQILFDGRYQLSKKVKNTVGTIPVIAFNDKNSLEEPADRQYVKLLKKSFPGAIITIEFYVDPTYIERSMKNIEKEKSSEQGYSGN